MEKRVKLKFYSVFLLSFIVLLLGIFVIIGWYSHSITLIQVMPFFVPMQYNTALCFLLLAVSLMCLLYHRERISALVALIVLIIALLTLVEYIAQVNLGIDQIFMTHYIDVQTSHPGRMAPNTALCFTLSSLFLLMASTLRLDTAEKSILSAMLALLVIVLGAIAFFGYLIGISFAYGWGAMTRMAVHTSLGFIIFGLAAYIASSIPAQQQAKISAVSARKSLIIFFIGVVIFTLIWQIESNKEYEILQRDIKQSGEVIGEEITQYLDLQQQALIRMQQRWQQSKTDKVLWYQDARSYVEDFKSLSALIWISPDDKKKWFVKKGHNQTKSIDKYTTFVMAKDTLDSNASIIFGKWETLNTNTVNMPIYLPLHVNGKFDGFFIAIVDITPLVQALIKNNYYIQIHYDNNFSGALSGFKYDHGVKFDDIYAQETIKTLGADLSFTLWPSAETIKRESSYTSVFTLVAGFLLSFLAALLMYIWQKLLQNERTAKEILSAVADGVCAIDLEHKLTFFNKAAHELLKIKEKSMINQNLIEMIALSQKQQEERKRLIASVVHQGETIREDDTVIVCKDGSSFFADVTISPIWQGTSKVQGVLITFKDVSERKRSQEVLQAQSNELEVSNKELESFSYSVSHDLRAPLRHIIGYINLLNTTLERIHLDERDVFKFMDIIKLEATKMGDLIDGLLAFSRAGRFALEKEEVDLNQMVNELKDELSSNKNKSTVLWDIANLPIIKCDRSMMYLVWQNLISNALKFSSKNGISCIQIGYQEKGNFYEFMIKDNGVGFDQKYVDKIFGVFQRLHGADEFEGTGIGLANVQRIIARHGGRVWAKGSENKGAEFYFTLPVRDLDSDAI
ncbi:sensor histidine kinase [Fangia hongkongensis]|uniref:sensor histidine kinase n=1 Tax=Fangia hongkongensis TaxID=270495 RepID=UPI000362A514|nr:ATP-binding protein [Fangia hongkongensis]MBK2125870.1 PAS domain S-box protein [Fangia hongkongensis]